MVKSGLRFEIQDPGANAPLPSGIEAAITRLGAALKGRATDKGTVRWFDLGL